MTVLFLPLYFAISGLRTNIGLLNDGRAWGMVVLIIFTACSGKIIGCTAAARAIRMKWRESLAVGVLMNCKGLVELVVLNIGLEAKVINDTVFTIMVLMALITTLMTTPLVSVVYPSSYYRKMEMEEEEGEMIDEATETDLNKILAARFRPLICLPGLRFVPTMMNMVKMMKNGAVKTKNNRIHAVRMVEITDRTSSLMKAAHHLDALNSDPVLQVFKTFGQLNDLDVRPHISFTTVEEVPSDLCEVAESNHLNAIVIPWQHPKDASAMLSYTSNHKHHHQIVRGVLGKFQKTVAVVLDRGLNVEESKNVKILVPFFGGPDDREALMFALNMRHRSGTDLVVLHVKLTDDVSSTGMKSPVNTSDVQINIQNVNGDEIEMISKNAASVSIQVEYHDEKDERLLTQLKTLIKSEGGKIELIETTASTQNPLKPVMEQMLVTPFTMVVFGFLGSQWAATMRGRPELDALNQKTTNSVALRNLAHLFNQSSQQHETTGSTLTAVRTANEQANSSTVRSILSAFRVGTSPAAAPAAISHADANNLEANLEANQYTVPRIAGLSAVEGLSTIEDAMGAESSVAAAVHAAQHDKAALRVLGEVGEAIWQSSEIKASMISVRNFHAS